MRKYSCLLFAIIFCIILSVGNTNNICAFAFEDISDHTSFTTEELIEEILFQDKIDEVFFFNDFTMGLNYYKRS